MQPVHQHLLCFVDFVVIAIMGAAAAIVNHLSTIETPGQLEELRLVTVPLLGAILCAGGMYLANVETEKRNPLLVRTFFALLLGSVFPAALPLLFSSLEPMSRHALLMLLSGVFCAMFFFGVSKPFITIWMERSNTVADKLEEEMEKRLHLPHQETQKLDNPPP